MSPEELNADETRARDVARLRRTAVATLGVGAPVVPLSGALWCVRSLGESGLPGSIVAEMTPAEFVYHGLWLWSVVGFVVGLVLLVALGFAATLYVASALRRRARSVARRALPGQWADIFRFAFAVTVLVVVVRDLAEDGVDLSALVGAAAVLAVAFLWTGFVERRVPTPHESRREFGLAVGYWLVLVGGIAAAGSLALALGRPLALALDVAEVRAADGCLTKGALLSRRGDAVVLVGRRERAAPASLVLHLRPDDRLTVLAASAAPAETTLARACPD